MTLDFKLPMRVSEIERCIPHRYPFLLIDKIVEYEKGAFIKAVKTVSGADPILQGHFPGNPVLPGVIIVEAMAQASAVLGKLTKGDKCDTCLLMEINEARFKRVVTAGDVLDLTIKVVKQRADFFWFSGEAHVGNELAATAQFSAKLA
ncbi:MAG: 3-hydroxyacyl-ACP dehydratase FabZ [Oligoflexales bacterium]